jgi:hypothetical protein
MTDANPSAPPAAPSEPPLRGLRLWAVVAEVVAAAAVVVSLVFVGVQLAQANVLARNAAIQEQIRAVQNLNREVYSNPAVLDAFARQARGETTPTDQLALDNFRSFAEHTWEALYWQHKAGQIPEELWEAHRRQADSIGAQSTRKAYWAANKQFYSKSYQEFRDASEAAAKPDAPSPAPQRAAPQQ